MNGPSLLALRIGRACHALEPGRSYVLGSADDCDLQLAGAAAHHARLTVTATEAVLEDLGSGTGSHHNGASVTRAVLAIGDLLRIGDVSAIVVRDDGDATLVPLPELRQAARARRFGAVRRAAAALRRNESHTFQAHLAEELRRSPWQALSLALHLLLLLLLWLLLPNAALQGLTRATVGVQLSAETASGSGSSAAVPDVVVEAVDEQPIATDPEPPQPTADTPVPDALPARVEPTSNPRLAPRSRAGQRGSGDDGNADRVSPGAGTGSFQQTVATLQHSGLDIVFVFDSTGSMTRTILDTKTTIAQMLAVLRLLVPGARVGLVTYRDAGRREEYVVRQVPLDADFWRAINFVQFVTAEGGGDRPEAVRAGLDAAFEQHWRAGARRVIVLAGDAPAHPEEVRPMMAAVRRFAADGRSFVHTLVTTPEHAMDDTLREFAEIAAAGHGVSEPIENHQRVLQRVLTLAFGREFERDLGKIVARAEQGQDRVDTAALHLARQGGSELTRALRDNPVPLELWNALVRRPRRATTELLVDVLAAADTPPHTRQAVAAALQRILSLQTPPIDPTSDQPPSRRRLEQLRAMATALPQ